MVTFFEASLDTISVHHVGNQSQSEMYSLSEQPLVLKDQLINSLLKQYFLSPFEKVNEVYHLMHSSDLNLNEIYSFATQAFDNKSKFHEVSEHIAKYLYKVANHPKIKSGELYVAYFRSVQIEGELLDAIGIFKSENKETYLKVYPDQGGYQVDYEENAININKLDKGVLIFNTEKENGYKVVVVDKSTSGQDAAVYWKDEFLQLKIRNDNFNQTNNTLSIYKNFVTNKIDEDFEVTKADKIDLLNRSMKYFKDKDTFDLDEFAGEVIGNPQAIESFKTYKQQYEDEYETPIADSFEISNNAVKKQARVYKSVLKLDKNFHIYIHGNKELIEKGFDDDKHMNYYKVYFKEEA
ncbi:MAG: nucleoid-associated protein [Sphingobacteriaceae bacterium]|nr:MAG: nucleoid-associated protein [Sphingobacteriaceae bacterium]